MENRSLSLAAGLILSTGCMMWSAPVWAQDAAAAKPTPEQRADWDSRLEQAKALQERGVGLKEEAKETFETRKQECFKKFRVTSCQQEAKQTYVQANNEARRIENEGKALEREVKKEELADKDARRLAREPRREAELKTREAEVQVEREEAEGARAAKLAEKEEQAKAGAERRAAADERQRKKQEQHEKKLAEKKEQARQREAEEGR